MVDMRSYVLHVSSEINDWQGGALNEDYSVYIDIIICIIGLSSFSETVHILYTDKSLLQMQTAEEIRAPLTISEARNMMERDTPSCSISNSINILLRKCKVAEHRAQLFRLLGAIAARCFELNGEKIYRLLEQTRVSDRETLQTCLVIDAVLSDLVQIWPEFFVVDDKDEN
jgi:hypothetical protein